MGLSFPRWVLVSGVLLPALFLIALAIIPVEFLSHSPTVCLFKNTVGIECLGCGMTRAISSVLHGDIAGAMQYNRFVVIVLPLLLIGMWWCFKEWVARVRWLEV